MNKKIYELKIREKELETKIIELIKKDNLSEEEKNNLTAFQNELKNVNKEIKELKESINNWTCSYSYTSKNGKIERHFSINNKEVSEQEYREFVVNKNMLQKKQNQFFSLGKMIDYIFNNYDENGSFTRLLNW